MTTFDTWGNQPWDVSPFVGGSLPTTLQIVGAASEAENVVRVQFNVPVYYSDINDGADGGTIGKWLVTPVAGTIGNDGNPARPVAVRNVIQPIVPNAVAGLFLDLQLEWPMTPYPAKYTVSATGLYTADQTGELNPANASAILYATYRVLEPVDVQAVVPARDFANPMSGAQAQASTIANPAVTSLGSFGYSDDGDYGIDSKDQGYFKRINRRTISKPGSYLHLGQNYGVGVPTYGKKLSRASTRDQLAAALEANYAQEPETQSAQVTLVPSAIYPSLVRLKIVLVKKGGNTAQYTMMLPTNGGTPQT